MLLEGINFVENEMTGMVVMTKSDFVKLIGQKIDGEDGTSKVNEVKPQGSVELAVTNALKELGVPCHIKGFNLLRDAISDTVNDFTNINRMITMYATLAQRHSDKTTRVERAIRHAIEVGWNRKNPAYAEKVFGTGIRKEKPANSEFIAFVADYLRLHQ